MGAPHNEESFAMPMYKDWFPLWLRPWVYLLMVVVFQTTSGTYLGNMAYMVGSEGLLQEDVMFIGLCGVVGVSVPFPLLFKFKFRFANKHLLMNATIVIMVCTVACMYVKSVPLLCVISFVAGFFKLCGTFECFSNIQLWMAPKRDFTIFFPLLYIFVLGMISLQPWLAVQVAYATGSWQMMHWLVAGMLLCILLFQVVCLKPFYIMHIPLRSIDWLGVLLWSGALCGVIWVFTYGEHYNWTDGKTWVDGCIITLILVLVCIARMMRIRHPYIEPSVFTNKKMWGTLALFALAEWFAGTPKVLGNAFIGGVLHMGVVTSSVLELVCFGGVVCASVLGLMWLHVWRWSLWRLLTIGFMALLAYQVLMYFLVSPTTCLEQLYLPIFLRGFGFNLFFIVCTIYVWDALGFQTFFMGMTVAGLVRNGPIGAVVSGVYSYCLRHDAAASTTAGLITDHQDMLLVALKQLFGHTSLLGLALLVLFLWHDAPVMGRSLKKIPSWHKIGKRLRRRERHNEKMRRKAAERGI